MQCEPLVRSPRRARKSIGEKLRDALKALANGYGELEHHSEKAWASITFAGSRHTVKMAFVGADAVAAGEGLVAALPDNEFSIPGQLVADATIIQVENTLLPEPRMLVECELLLLEEA